MTAENIGTRYLKRPDNNSICYTNANLDFSIVIVQKGVGVKQSNLTTQIHDLISPLISKGFRPEENEVLEITEHKLLLISCFCDDAAGKIFDSYFFTPFIGKRLLVALNTGVNRLE